MLPELTFEGFVTTFIYGLPLAAFLALSAWLWRFSFRFVHATRRRRRYANFCEVRRRVKNLDYLLYKEATVNALQLGLIFLTFLAVLITLLWGVSKLNIWDLLLLIILFLMGGSLPGVIATLETDRNLAARAFRAGLRRDRRTRQFI